MRGEMKYIKFIAGLLLITAFDSVYATMNKEFIRESADKPGMIITETGRCYGDGCPFETIDKNIRFRTIPDDIILDFKVY